MSVDPSMSETRRAIDQRFQVAFGAPDREILQHVAAGIHDGDDHAGQRFAERKAAAIERSASSRRRFAPREGRE